MFRFSTCVLAFIGFVMSGPIAAADPATPSAGQAASTDPALTENLDRIECRTLAPETGTRLGARRECRTIRAWNEIRDAGQKALIDVQSRGLQHTLPGS